MRRRVIHGLERREAGGYAGLEGQVSAPAGAHEDLGAAAIVDENLLGPKLLGLGQGEVLDHGLAGARRPADEGVADIADVEIEIVG